MAGLFVDPLAQRAREQSLLTTQTDFSALAPGTFEGIPSGLGQGLSRAGATIEALSADTMAYLPMGQLMRTYDAVTGSNTFGRSKAIVDDTAARWLADSRLDPATHGSVSQILYGVASQAPAIAATFVNPLLGGAVAAGTTFEGSNADLQAQGVDPNAAHEAALSDSLFAAVGALLPGAIGANRVANALLVGPGINIAQDVAGRYTAAQSLEANGYTELAAQYRHLDATTLIADAIIGGAFGYAGAKHTQGEIDAALVQRDLRERMFSGLGTPVDAVSQAKHIAALNKATEDLANGRPVDVSGIVGAKFLHDPKAALADVLERSGYHEEAAQIRELEAQLAERGIDAQGEVDLPTVPLPKVDPKPAVAAEPKATPDGQAKPDALAPHEQAAVTQAEAIVAEHSQKSNFDRWFAGSKVVNKDGNPLIMYHGTQQDFDAFDLATVGSGGATPVNRGFFFDSNYNAAMQYGKHNVLEVHLAATKPLTVKAKGDAHGWFDANAERLLKKADANGNDSIVIIGEDGHKTVVVFDPGQIKSAEGNSGRYDRNNPSMTDTIATPSGDIPIATALASADKAVETATAESTQFAAAVDCALRHGV